MPEQRGSTNRHQPKGVVILHEDRDILVVDKSPGLLTVETAKEKVRTAHYALTDYLRKGYARSKKQLYLVHRLDRETSGVLIFAKSEKARQYLQDNWKDTEKKYLAVVYGKLADKAGTITTYLAENKAYVVYSTSDTTKGRLSHTAYRVLKETREFSLLEIDLLTGRKNQIRVHLAERGHPVVGDRKYGRKDDVHRRLALHARSISFKHPFSETKLIFEAKVPRYFNKLIGSMDA